MGKNKNSKSEDSIDSKTLLSEESEEYTFEDIVEVKDEEENYPKSFIGNKFQKYIITSEEDYKISFDNKEYKLNKPEDVKNILKEVSNKFNGNVSGNINKFTGMTNCENSLKDLYKELQELSKSRGNANRIIEIGSKIQEIESEKKDNFVSTDSIQSTIDDIQEMQNVLLLFQNILTKGII